MDDLHSGGAVNQEISLACLDELDTNGFVRFNFLSEESLQMARESFDARMSLARVTKGASTETDLGCEWHHELIRPFMNCLVDDALVDVLAEVCGLPFVAIRLELFEKLPGSETVIPWHQDTYTHHSGFEWTPEKAVSSEWKHPCTLWVALDDCNTQNGGMEMVIGRHKELLNVHGAVPPQMISVSSKCDYSLKAGQAGLHHPLCPHRSCENKSDAPRRAFLVRFSPWTDLIDQNCKDAERAALKGWPIWTTHNRRYAWYPGNEACLSETRQLNRLLICDRATSKLSTSSANATDF